MALSGFGGVLPVAYRGIVEQRKWLTASEFTTLLSSAQVLPGPTICNVTLMVGARLAGMRGALAAIAGMLGGPILVVIGMGMLYQRFGDLAMVRSALAGMSAVAAGLIAGVAIKLAMPLLATQQKRAWHLLFIALGFVGMGLLKFPMIEVIAVLAPITIGIAYWKGRR
jgi:chromate transporter